MVAIPVYKPFLPPQSLRYAHEALDSTWVSSNGPYLRKTQERLQELLRAKHVLLVNNGTSATHLLSKALGKFGNHRGSMIVPANVYVAAWNAFLFDGSDAPVESFHVVDSNLDTWNMDETKVCELLNARSTWKHPEVGVLAVHNVGNPINVPALLRSYPMLANTVVEDNCEGFLGLYEGRSTGTAALASSLSFFGNKNITSGEGGAVVTNRTDVFEYLQTLHGQGQSSTRFVHHHLGYNYRMTNIQAALLYGQLDVLDEILSRKYRVFSRYRALVNSMPGVVNQKITAGCTSADWMFGVRIPGNVLPPAQVSAFFERHGIEVRPMFYPITTHRHLKHLAHEEDLPVATQLNRECVILPSYPELTMDEQDHVLNTLQAYVTECVPQ